MSTLAKWLLAAVIALIVAGVVVDWSYRGQLDAAKQRADALHQQAEVLEGVAEFYKGLAVASDQYAATLHEKATARDTVIRRKTDTLTLRIAALPDTGVAARDTIIAEQQDIIKDQQDNYITLGSAFAKQKEAYARLSVANDTLRAANDSLHTAFDLLRHPPRRPLFAVLFHPKIRPAVFAGICQDRKLCAGAGMAAAWEF